MAMIVCPGCGKEISDKAEVCPKCGYTFEKKEEIKRIVCEECGNEFDENLDSCPNCGCPKPVKQQEVTPQKVEVTKVSVNKKKIIMGVSVVAVIVLAIIGGIFAKNIIDKKNAEKNAKAYFNKLESATTTMFSGCASAESAAGLIHDVWYNAIYEKSDSQTDEFTKPDGYFVSDFNDALFNLQMDSSFSADIKSIESNQETVEKMMKQLKNPPEEHKEAYDTLKEFYDCYLEFTNLAVNPTGNLTSYTSDYNDLDSEVMNKYKKMKMYFE